MKKIAILGSTGSIGTQTLEIVRSHPDDLTVTALAANTNIEQMEAQIREFAPAYAAMADENAARILQQKVADLPVKVYGGIEGLIELTQIPQVEMVVTAIVGMIGLRPTIAAIQAGKDIALANKETLVTAGHIIMPLVKKHGVRLLPVDSEHSAIFQSLGGEKREDVAKIILTASGGPFRGMKTAELQKVTASAALCHPTWKMGAKITIDSATLVNKGLEVIEARWLFDIEASQIEVVVHPQSIIHSMVEFVDGAVIAQLGLPDMKLPIKYALFYPKRKALPMGGVDFAAWSALTFMPPDAVTFRGLSLAYEALAAGGSMPTVFNAANEKVVSLFLSDKIGFLQIYDMIAGAMACHRVIESPTIEEILETEVMTHQYVMRSMR
ncbi:MAG: 1-deoxy-D-xylulose-5-phosphate reductoisomerase [Lachnospiraceae bacterium]|jgi:1-deoxy-D-xylulose-5-phosphate reductoisomerase|nr:1-deoxy-D-xylulose-5-phosphate reductoisomerase [Lachnospiraceae bacterium]